MLSEAEAARSCNSCHGSYKPALLSISAPDPLASGVENPIKWTVSAPWRNSWIEPKIDVVVTNGNSTPSSFVPWEASLARGKSASGWIYITPDNSSTTVDLTITLDVIAWYDHSSSSKPDRQQEVIEVSLNIAAGFQDLQFSPSVITWEAGNLSSTVWNYGSSNISNLSITTLNGNLSFGQKLNSQTTSFNGTLLIGEGVEIEYNGSIPSASGTLITISGQKADGSVISSQLTIIPNAIEVPYSDVIINSSIGILYGWLALGAIAGVSIQGFTKRKLDRKYGVARKETRKSGEEWLAETPSERASYWWWLHSSLLGGILFFTTIHVLGLGLSDSMAPMSLELLAGVVSIILIAITGYSGLFPKLSKRVMKKLSFRKGHMVLGLLGTALAIWHTWAYY